VVVEGGTAYVSGFDGDAPLHYRYCIVERYDVRTGERLDRLDPVAGQVGDRDPLNCRHGGGLVRDGHGLWLVETSRLWLIDPATLDVQRVWALAPPLRGSFSLVDGRGRIGIGRWYPHRPAQVDWFDPDALASGTALDITPAMSTGHTAAPRATQGAVWAALGGRPAAPWFAQSVTRCGILAGPDGAHRRSFVPGAGSSPAPTAPTGGRSSPARRAWTWSATRCGWSASPAPGTTSGWAGGRSSRSWCGWTSLTSRRGGGRSAASDMTKARRAGLGGLRRRVRSASDQRVSRCRVCLRSRGQNFIISSRSGSFRRFFLVM